MQGQSSTSGGVTLENSAMKLRIKIGHMEVYGEGLDRKVALGLIAAPVISWGVWIFLGG
jgi:hypothetical protein